MECAGATPGSGGPEPSGPPQSEYKGYGEVDPASGLYPWYDFSEEERSGYTWPDIIEYWDLIEADMNERYHVDLSEPGLLERRTGRWLRVRILGLLAVESRLFAALIPQEVGKP